MAVEMTCRAADRKPPMMSGRASGISTFDLTQYYSRWRDSGGPAACEVNLFYWSYPGGTQVYNLLHQIRFDAD